MVVFRNPGQKFSVSHTLVSQSTKNSRKVFIAGPGTRNVLFKLNTLFSAFKTISSYNLSSWLTVLTSMYSY